MVSKYSNNITQVIVETGNKTSSVPKSRNTPDHIAPVLRETLSVILFGFHFKYKYQFKDTWLDFLPLNGLVCLDKLQTTRMEHVLTYQEIQASKQPHIWSFGTISIDWSNIQLHIEWSHFTVGIQNDISRKTKSGNSGDSFFVSY